MDRPINTKSEMTENHQIGITFHNPARNRELGIKDFRSKRISIHTKEDSAVELYFPSVWKIEVISIEKLGEGHVFYMYKIRICYSFYEKNWTINESTYKNLLTQCNNYKD